MKVIEHKTTVVNRQMDPTELNDYWFEDGTHVTECFGDFFVSKGGHDFFIEGPSDLIDAISKYELDVASEWIDDDPYYGGP